MDYEGLIALLVFIVPMCFSPGPNNMLCAAHGSQHGFRASIPLTLGMLVGWSSLGLAVGMATVFIEENQEAFLLLTYIGAAYIAYLGYKIAFQTPLTEKEGKETERLGFSTGLMLQIVNGKAWVHFLVLMTSWGTLFGTGFASKATLVAINATAGYPAVLTWSAFGVGLSKIFSTPEKARILNGILGVSLFAVAIWISLPH
ncbi:MAG: LysE family translocator [Candidatus Thalassarchaeaceae archaeon]|jgi:threonine/homoserine/homoserine lactone efflux protein